MTFGLSPNVNTERNANDDGNETLNYFYHFYPPSQHFYLHFSPSNNSLSTHRQHYTRKDRVMKKQKQAEKELSKDNRCPLLFLFPLLPFTTHSYGFCSSG